MKKMLSLTLFFPALLFAQEKSPGFITKYHYLKISPTMLLLAHEPDNVRLERGLTPALFATIGGKISRYMAVGFQTGFFNLKRSSTVVPLGAELTITDFKKKVFPVITAQWSRTHFKQNYFESAGRYSHSYNITGKQMYGISGGAAVQAFQTKILITAGYSRLERKTIITSTYAPYGGSGTINQKDRLDFLTFSLGLVF
jgi:hypothetical protein